MFFYQVFKFRLSWLVGDKFPCSWALLNSTADSSEWRLFQLVARLPRHPCACGDIGCTYPRSTGERSKIERCRRRGESVLLKLSMNKYYNSKYGTIKQNRQPFLRGGAKLQSPSSPVFMRVETFFIYFQNTSNESAKSAIFH